MITDAATIQKLALRSELPRLKDEGFFLSAQLQAQEQMLAAPAKFDASRASRDRAGQVLAVT